MPSTTVGAVTQGVAHQVADRPATVAEPAGQQFAELVLSRNPNRPPPSPATGRPPSTTPSQPMSPAARPASR